MSRSVRPSPASAAIMAISQATLVPWPKMRRLLAMTSSTATLRVWRSYEGGGSGSAVPSVFLQGSQEELLFPDRSVPVRAPEGFLPGDGGLSRGDCG